MLNKSILSENSDYQEVKALLKSSSKWMLLCDDNTFELCSANFLKKVNIVPDAIYCIEAGEVNKELNQVESVYERLLKEGFDRQSLIVNLGGGIVCDLGGFVAATFKRGIAFINVPTTLLSVIDAAQGGKTGVNFKGVKNQIGVFCPAEVVVTDLSFLKTLELEALISGFAEMIKHGLIAHVDHWNEIKKLDHSQLEKLSHNVIKTSIEIKRAITELDPLELAERKKLNFGHTIGHAVESFFTNKGISISHGRAIAIGMICETKLSIGVGLKSNEATEIIDFLQGIYGEPNLLVSDISALMTLMSFDKKNERGALNFTLLTSIGAAIINQELKAEQVEQCLTEYIKGK